MNRVFSDDELLELHNQGLIVEEIAKKFRRGVQCIKDHYKRLGLKENLTAVEKKRIELYIQGMSDYKIGNELFMSSSATSCWRKSHHLPPVRSSTTEERQEAIKRNG